MNGDRGPKGSLIAVNHVVGDAPPVVLVPYLGGLQGCSIGLRGCVGDGGNPASTASIQLGMVRTPHFDRLRARPGMPPRFWQRCVSAFQGRQKKVWARGHGGGVRTWPGIMRQPTGPKLTVRRSDDGLDVLAPLATIGTCATGEHQFDTIPSFQSLHLFALMSWRSSSPCCRRASKGDSTTPPGRNR